LGLTLNLRQWGRFGAHYRSAVALKEVAGAEFRLAGESLNVSVAGLHFNVETGEELFILFEIFVANAYKFIPARETVVLDVGANAGFASLYFAKQASTLAVLAFEPFTETIEAAKRNIALNPDVANRIEYFCKAVSDVSGQREFYYSPSHRGSSGATSPTAVVDDHFTKRVVDAIAAEEVFTLAESRFPGAELTVKLDCEGCEYSIVRRLDALGLVRRAASYLVEWHRWSPDHDREALVEAFRKNGFHVFEPGERQEHIGMLYAARHS
jgi:FkbM family methyltransferase